MRMSDGGDRAEAPGSADEFAGVDELISDLAALLDAGLVVVDEPVLGPARYGVAPTPNRRHSRRDARTSELRRHHAQLT
jgi:hypothetical protein